MAIPENTNELAQLTRSLGYGGGIAHAGAEFLARYLLASKNRITALEEQVAALKGDLLVLKSTARDYAPSVPPLGRQFAVAPRGEVR